jgi:hypothetical protein
MATDGDTDEVVGALALTVEDVPADPVAERCRNCGHAVLHTYCPACGQKASDVRRPLASFIHDAMQDLLALDNRLLRTVGQLIWHPGRVAMSYTEGCRARYTPPLRLFLFSLLTLILVTAWTSEDTFTAEPSNSEAERNAQSGDDTAQSAAERSAAGERADDIAERVEGRSEDQAQESDSESADAESADQAESEDSTSVIIGISDEGPVDLPLNAELEERIRLGAERLETNLVLFQERFSRWYPRIWTAMAFVLALISAMLYWRRYLAEHAIFSLYLHGALCLVATAEIALAQVPFVTGWLILIFVIYVLYYIGASLRRFYGGRRWSTIFRMLFAGLLYSIVLLVMVAAIALYEIWRLGGASPTG